MLRALLCFALAGAWAAEESAQESAPDTERVAERIDADATTPDEADDEAEIEASDIPEGESPDTFIPSEDISESIAVKFPADI